MCRKLFHFLFFLGVVLLITLFIPHNNADAENTELSVSNFEEDISYNEVSSETANYFDDQTIQDENLLNEEDTVDKELEFEEEDESGFGVESYQERNIESKDLDVSITVTNSDGEMDPEVDQFTPITVNVDLSIPDGTFHENDTSIIQLPESVKLDTTEEFSVYGNNGEIVAQATVDSSSNEVVLHFTDFVERHTNISAILTFVVKVDYNKQIENGVIPLRFVVNNKMVHGPNVTYENYVEEGLTETLTKYGWVHSIDPSLVSHRIRVVPPEGGLKGAILEDQLQTGFQFLPDSILIQRGIFYTGDHGGLEFEALEVADFPWNLDETKSHLIVNFGDLDASNYLVSYTSRFYRPLQAGESVLNKAVLYADGIDPKVVESIVRTYTATGSAVGYNYTIQINKINDVGQPLSGAKFRVIREKDQVFLGDYITDYDGIIMIQNVSKNDYIITEIEAPKGYNLLTDPTVLTENKFDLDDVGQVTITNTKINIPLKSGNPRESEESTSSESSVPEESQPDPSDSPESLVPEESQPEPSDSPESLIPEESQPESSDSPESSVPKESLSTKIEESNLDDSIISEIENVFRDEMIETPMEEQSKGDSKELSDEDLPKTGEEKTVFNLLLGSLLIVIALFAFLYEKVRYTRE